MAGSTESLNFKQVQNRRSGNNIRDRLIQKKVSCVYGWGAFCHVINNNKYFNYLPVLHVVRYFLEKRLKSDSPKTNCEMLNFLIMGG